MKSSLVFRPVNALVATALVVSAFAAACTSGYESEPNTAGTGGTSSTTGGAGPTSGGTAGGGTTNGGTGGSAGSGGTTGGTGGSGGTTGGTGGVGGAGATSGTAGVGGAGAGGGQAGSAMGGGAGIGGMSGAGGSDPSTGGTAGTAGEAASGGSAGAAAGSGGSGGMTASAEGPCDIYEDAEVPCVAAYSVARVLRSAYTGPLYQLRRGGPDPNTGSGGELQDINAVNGFADKAAHDAFCGTMTCTFATLYDQSGRGNNLTVGKAGCYEGTAAEDDYESDAKRRPTTTASGAEFYALYMDKHEGYRDNQTMGMPTGQAEQGIYMVAEGSGKRPGAGCCCCWNFGNASTDNCYGPSGQMNALFMGTGYWGKGAGSGPWFLGDFEAGVWAGGTGASNATNSQNPSMTMDYAFGILKSHASNYALRMGDAQTGNLTTAYDGGIPTAFNGRWTMEGGIILGIGGDNSNSSDGTFIEGAITAGRPDDATDELVYRNVQAIGYGQ